MGSAEDLLGVGVASVIAKAAGESIGMILECTCLRADTAGAGLAGSLPMNAGVFFDHCTHPWELQTDPRAGFHAIPVPLRRRQDFSYSRRPPGRSHHVR